MHEPSAAAKAMALVLCASIMASTAGCKTGQERAGEHRDLVSVGMTQAEVVDQLGTPDIRRADETAPNQEVWFYQYSVGGIGIWIAVILATLTIIGAFSLGVIGADKHYFKVEFDHDGRVKALGPVRPLIDRNR